MTAQLHTDTVAPIINREHWLSEFSQALRPLFKSAGVKFPTNFRVSCSWPASRGTANKNRTIGQCFNAECSADGHHEVFISPTMDDAIEVGETLVHELLHAALPKGVGHKKPFARAAVAIGLDGKPTATQAGDKLRVQLQEIADRLGAYPHGAIDLSGMKKQTTRLLKVVCPECGYTARITRTWLEVGLPICPQCNCEFEEDYGQEISTALICAESHMEYHLKGERRFTIRMSKAGKADVRWHIIDYGEDAFAAQPRLTPAESRQDALDLIDALKEGLLTYEDLEENVDDLDADNDYDEVDDEADYNDMSFLADDEEEFPDNDDSLIVPNSDEDIEYERISEIREASGARTSQRIASFDEKALD